MKRYQNLIIIGLIIIAAFFAYSFFFAAKPEAALSSTAPTASNSVDQDLITLLLQLRAIKLDNSIFTNPVFTSLQDFSQALVPEAVGRTNPFAPLGAPQQPKGK
jgi:hypothetical protein